MADIFSKAKKIYDCETPPVLVKTPYDELYRTYINSHVEIYGERPNPCFPDFEESAKEFTKTFNLDPESEVTHKMLVRYMTINRDENDEPFNKMCTPKMLKNKFNWRKVKSEFGESTPRPENEKEKVNDEYFGIKVYPLYIILDNGISKTKVMKAKCHSVEKDGLTYYYPKDNRLQSQYDYRELSKFLDLPQEHDFGDVPYINGTPCYGFYVCGTYPNSCSEKCGKFKKLKYLFKASEIPEKYLFPIQHTEAPQVENDESLKILMLQEIKENICEYVNSGDSFVFYSNQTGTGKTSWACTIAKGFIFRQMKKNMLTPEAVYVNVSEYFALLKSSIGLNDEKLKIEIIQLNNLIKEVPLLIFDDIGTEKGTEYTQDTLYQIINHRYSKNLSTIYTTNLLLDSQEAEAKLGKRIISRLQESTIIDFDGEVR